MVDLDVHLRSAGLMMESFDIRFSSHDIRFKSLASDDVFVWGRGWRTAISDPEIKGKILKCIKEVEDHLKGV